MPTSDAASNCKQPEIPPTRHAFLTAAHKWLGYLMMAILLSFLLPLSVVMAPMIARTYVHVWKVALGLEPDCAYPSRTYSPGMVDCDMPSAPSKKGDALPRASSP